MAVSQSVARPLRTGVQLLSAGVVVEFVDAFFYDFTDRQYAAAVALVTMLLGFLQVLVEDRAGKAFLREPSPPEQPVTTVEERGAFDAGILITIAAIVVIICGVIFIAQAL